MAFVHWLEDWGSTLGTTGLGTFGTYATPGFSAGGDAFTAADAYLSSPSFGTIGLRSSITFSGVGTPSGSQYHVGSATGIASGDQASLYTKLTEYDGTGLWLRAGMTSAGRYIAFLTKPESTTAWTVGSAFNDTAGAGGARAFSVWGTHVGSGTWVGTITDSEPKTSVLTYAAGAGYLPASLPALAIGGYTNSAILRVLSSSWEYTANVYDSILRFIGTWATGSGTYEWGADVIGAPSNIQDRAFGPLDSAGWASTVSVTLDDSRGQWGSFAGTGQWPYEGTWQFRRQWNAGEVSGTWVTLLTGFVEPESVQYDYARRTARLTVQSSIARASQKIAIHDGNTFSSRQMSVPCYQGLLGTITYADSSTGTIRVGNVQGGYWQPESRCRLWGTFGTETESVTVGSSITPIGIFGAGGTGTLVVNGEFPDWMAVGNEVWLTRPWPSYSDRNSPASGLAFTYAQALLDRLGLTWPADNQLLFQKQSAATPISPNFRMYGGEKLTTALTGIMQACNGFFSVSPAGEFRVHCNLPTYSAAGSVDFLTAYDSDWSMGYEASVTGIELDSSFNPATGSYSTHTSVGGTTAWGAVRELKLPWVGSGIEAESLAGRLYRDSYIPRPSLTLRMPGSRWDGYDPGYIYNVNNLPTHLVSKMAGTQFVLYSKTHDWQDDLTALELVALPGGNYAVWDGTPADTWHESGKVWY